jgi:hypothetical protein
MVIYDLRRRLHRLIIIDRSHDDGLARPDRGETHTTYVRRRGETETDTVLTRGMPYSCIRQHEYVLKSIRSRRRTALGPFDERNIPAFMTRNFTGTLMCTSRFALVRGFVANISSVMLFATMAVALG